MSGSASSRSGGHVDVGGRRAAPRSRRKKLFGGAVHGNAEVLDAQYVWVAMVPVEDLNNSAYIGADSGTDFQLSPSRCYVSPYSHCGSLLDGIV
ncbi:hypothetical protein [Oceanidesulfovibrio marinus]|uniref:Uncharacterized protein n=1 Tax=Oceanidesulfovibrio marinus TaxID=370038 RepID=A0ABX6ND62_9BACT|nr:hypothetical protein [Oceanidesulfovibrio marinus]QJT08538.1 hypothetical protein E8L03_06185 [Oceanidesulfovibrio marinus]